MPFLHAMQDLFGRHGNEQGIKDVLISLSQHFKCIKNRTVQPFLAVQCGFHLVTRPGIEPGLPP